MIFLISAMSFIFSCEKEAVIDKNYLPGKWNLIKTELYESNVLKGEHHYEEMTTTYFFYDCETVENGTCDMYIEEDGEQERYTYAYDKIQYAITLNGSILFNVVGIDSHQLKLARSYDNYKSTYLFIKED